MSTDEKTTVWDLAREIYRRFPLILIAIALVTVAVGLMESAALVTIAPLADYVVNPDPNKASALTSHVISAIKWAGLPYGLGTLVAVFLILNLSKSALAILAQYSITRLSFAVFRQLVLPTFKDFFEARWYFFSSNRMGVLLNTLLRESNVAVNAVVALGNVVSSGVLVGVILIVPIYISWQVTAICVATALILALPLLILGRVVRWLGQRNTEAFNEVTSVVQQSLGSAKLILGFGNSSKSLAELERAFRAFRRSWVKHQTISAAMPQLYYPVGLVVAMVGLFYTQYVALPLSDAAVILYALLRMNSPMGLLIANKTNLNAYLPSYEQIRRLAQSAQEMKQPSGNVPFKGFHREILLQNVSFAYPGLSASLSNVNVRIAKGRMIAFVGASGAGKSTLIDIMMGFHEPTAGNVTIDGAPLRDFDMVSYRRKIGYVPQESLLFNATITENLRWANENATEQEIEQACRQAGASEFIEELPRGYETVVGDRGVRLSGGQVQRIAMARAILRQPQLLILDEATSSLDTVSERLIQEAVDKMAGETSVVIVAHRLSTILRADYIYVLDKGEIIEEGSYLDLMSTDSEFAKMASLQNLATETPGSEPTELVR